MKVKCLCRDGCMEEFVLTCSQYEAVIIVKALKYAYGERWHKDTPIVIRMLDAFDNFELVEESDG